MKSQVSVSLFPFLSVLLSTMGVLSFLAITFLLFAATPETPDPQEEQKAELRWIGAPEYVRPMLAEAGAEGLRVFRRRGEEPYEFKLAELRGEVVVVKSLLETGYKTMGNTPDRTSLWLFLKTAIPKEKNLRSSFTMILHEMELDNINGRARDQRIERYPILLIYPDGVETYQLASFLVETTTRLSLGLEPILPGWDLPYRDLTD
ncbi:MAG: hypothetical protein OEZ59_08055 [Deltaproteobacteria bacterium]|nr:hypothetical protein [Deltaproteobacteria bacterium]